MANYYDAGQQQAVTNSYLNQVSALNAGRNTVNQGYLGMENQWGQFGDAQRTALQRQYTQQLAASQQSMADRGLYNTTMLDSQQRGINYDQANSMVNLNDQLLQNKMGVEQNRLGYLGQVQQQAQGINANYMGFLGGVAQQNAGYAAQSALAGQQFGYQQQLQAQQLASQRSMQANSYAMSGGGGGGGGGVQGQMPNTSFGRPMDWSGSSGQNAGGYPSNYYSPQGMVGYGASGGQSYGGGSLGAAYGYGGDS